MLSKLEQHLRKWDACRRCYLHKHRHTVVLVRGTLPSRVLFVGEAPGASENVLKRPFVGPAGKLLDRIIAASGLTTGDYAMTNLIACIPLEDGGKVSAPPSEAIKACAPRLVEMFELAKPKLIVWVGAEAQKHGPRVTLPYFDALDTGNHPSQVSLLHPAAILRLHITQQGLAIQRCVVVLRDAVEEVFDA